jgi:hypothetical protein
METAENKNSQGLSERETTYWKLAGCLLIGVGVTILKFFGVKKGADEWESI